MFSTAAVIHAWQFFPAPVALYLYLYLEIQIKIQIQIQCKENGVTQQQCTWLGSILSSVTKYKDKDKDKYKDKDYKYY